MAGKGSGIRGVRRENGLLTYFEARFTDVDAGLRIEGVTYFNFSDRFEDPVGLGIELGGNPYLIPGHWSANFEAEMFFNEGESEFK